MKAMIFAAGLGTRLKPLTDTMPKALVNVHGKPLISHVIDKLADAGFDDFVVNVHHFAQMIKDYLSEYYASKYRIAVSDEQTCLLETGGGILKAETLLKDGNPAGEPFLVHNVDILSNVRFDELMSQWRDDAMALLLVSARKTSRYLLFDNDMRLVGWTNVVTGELRSPYPGLNPDNCRKYAFSGIHLVSDSIFSIMREAGMPERFPIMDFYLRVAALHPVYGALQDDLKLVDAGKVDTLEKLESQADILSQLP